MDIQEAIDAPRIHHQWLPDKVYVEAHGLSPDTLKLLAGMGHRLEIAGEGKTWGQAAGILVGGESLGEIEQRRRRALQRRHRQPRGGRGGDRILAARVRQDELCQLAARRHRNSPDQAISDSRP